MVESNRLLIYRTFICTQGSNPCFSYFKKTLKVLTWISFIAYNWNHKTKFGTVVQLVRAPPCHGGSCEFESRQSRFFFFNFCIFSIYKVVTLALYLVYKLLSNSNFLEFSLFNFQSSLIINQHFFYI